MFRSATPSRLSSGRMTMPPRAPDVLPPVVDDVGEATKRSPGLALGGARREPELARVGDVAEVMSAEARRQAQPRHVGRPRGRARYDGGPRGRRLVHSTEPGSEQKEPEGGRASAGGGASKGARTSASASFVVASQRRVAARRARRCRRPSHARRRPLRRRSFGPGNRETASERPTARASESNACPAGASTLGLGDGYGRAGPSLARRPSGDYLPGASAPRRKGVARPRERGLSVRIRRIRARVVWPGRASGGRLRCLGGFGLRSRRGGGGRGGSLRRCARRPQAPRELPRGSVEGAGARAAAEGSGGSVGTGVTLESAAGLRCVKCHAAATSAAATRALAMRSASTVRGRDARATGAGSGARAAAGRPAATGGAGAAGSGGEGAGGDDATRRGRRRRRRRRRRGRRQRKGRVGARAARRVNREDAGAGGGRKLSRAPRFRPMLRARSSCVRTAVARSAPRVPPRRRTRAAPGSRGRWPRAPCAPRASARRPPASTTGLHARTRRARSAAAWSAPRPARGEGAHRVDVREPRSGRKPAAGCSTSSTKLPGRSTALT